MKYLLIALVSIFIGTCASAQCITCKLSSPGTHKHALLSNKAKISIGDSTLPTPTQDSVYNGPRFGGLSVVYGVSPGYTASNVAALLGLDWTHATYTAATKSWYVNWTAGLCIGSNTHSAPASISEVACAGVRGTFFNGYLVVGVLYNFARPTGATSNFMGATGGNTFFVPTN
jgi:hypothetical protein